MAAEAERVEKKTKRMLSAIITPASLARERNCSHDTAKRWLERLDAQSGGKLLLRSSNMKGARIYTTLSRLRRVDPLWLEDRETREADVERLEKKLDALQEELRSVKSRAREMIQRLKEREAITQ